MKFRANLIGLASLSVVTVVFLLLGGCASTKAAYQTAETLQDRAYVLTEHYAALVHEAADLKDQGNLPPEAVKALRDAANASAPFVLGNPNADPPVPSLRDLAKAYEGVASAENKDALQLALTSAIRQVASFIKALRAAQLSHRTSDENVPPSGDIISDRYISWAGGEA